jgi:hypothetical protein
MNEKKLIPSGVFRCFKFDVRLLYDMLFQYLIIILGFALVWQYTDMMSPINVVLLFTSLIPMVMTMQRYTTYFNQMVGFGLSRRNFINGGLLAKPVYMLFSVIMCTITAIITNTPREWAAFIIFIGFFASLFMSSVGDLLGVLILRFNRVGYIIFITIYIIVLILIGILTGYMAVNGISLYSLSSNVVKIIIASVSIAASTVIYIVVRTLLKRIAIK